MLDSLYTPFEQFILFLVFGILVLLLVIAIVYTVYAFITASNKASWGHVPSPSKEDTAARDSDNLRRLQEMAMLERAARLIKDGEIKK